MAQRRTSWWVGAPSLGHLPSAAGLGHLAHPHHLTWWVAWSVAECDPDSENTAWEEERRINVSEIVLKFQFDMNNDYSGSWSIPKMKVGMIKPMSMLYSFSTLTWGWCCGGDLLSRCVVQWFVCNTNTDLWVASGSKLSSTADMLNFEKHSKQSKLLDNFALEFLELCFQSIKQYNDNILWPWVKVDNRQEGRWQHKNNV